MNIVKKMEKKGISPVIASIILIAITVAVAIAVAGWVFGLFGTYGTAGGVTVINPTLDDTGTFTATVKNDKDTAVSVVSVTATGDGGTPGAAVPDLTVNAHTTGTLASVTITGATFSAGNAYVVKVTFSDGTIASVSVTATAAPSP